MSVEQAAPFGNKINLGSLESDNSESNEPIFCVFYCFVVLNSLHAGHVLLYHCLEIATG